MGLIYLWIQSDRDAFKKANLGMSKFSPTEKEVEMGRLEGGSEVGG